MKLSPNEKKQRDLSTQKLKIERKKKRLIDLSVITQSIHKRIETPWYKDTTLAKIKKAIDTLSPCSIGGRITHSGLEGLKFLPGIGVFPGKLSFSFTGYNSANLSVCGAPWMGMYDLGALKIIQTEFKDTILNESVVLGTGSGCFAALAFALKLPVAKFEDELFKLNQQSQNGFLGPIGKMLKRTRNTIDKLLEFREYHFPTRLAFLKSIEGRLHISVTEYPSMKNVIISKFESKEHLIDCIIASLHVPVYFENSVKVQKTDGVICHINGAFSERSPVLDKFTIVLSPLIPETEVEKSNTLNTLSDWDVRELFKFGKIGTSELILKLVSEG
ncbi:hypothetical protein HK096_009528, partial [Nowakowskiella sp. JEL0078]